ncbi:MAG: PAS domain S-box protein [Desulfobacterales bacterium]|nr:PAS domain S-box protein [Desulfobacterales bacterium]
MADNTANHIAKKEDSELHRDRYRVFIEDVADGFYETDLHGDFKFFNDAMCRIFGYSEEEIRDRNYCEFMDQKNAEFAFMNFNTIFRTGKGITDIIWEITRKDGEIRIVEISANLITDSNGQKAGFRGIARDITEKHLVQQSLKESEQRANEQYQASKRAEKRFRSLLHFLPDPVFVFNQDGTVTYVNPAFENVFGWTLDELRDKRIPFVPDSLVEEARQGTRRLYKEKVIHNFETRRLTKDGRLLDIVLNAAIFYEEENDPSGQVAILRDITREKRTARSNQALFSIAKALPQFRRLDDRLEFITREVQNLINVEGASVILVDEETKEFFFRVASYDDIRAGKILKETRFPLGKGIAGCVYRTGQPLVVQDTSESTEFFHQVDEKTGYQTKNILDVPICIRDRVIGVLCAVNKKHGDFDQADIEFLGTIANTVAIPIENAMIDEELKRTYDEIQGFNRAKERVLHHLSHELKTPVSVLDASFSLLSKKLSRVEDRGWGKILDRAKRNLSRILEMQYEIEDIIRQRDYKTYNMLSALLEACTDELEALFEDEIEKLKLETGNWKLETGFQDITRAIRKRTEELFGPRDAISEAIYLSDFVKETIQTLGPCFAHRKCNIKFQASSFKFHQIWIPSEVLSKITEGLIRNALENTPDGGQIEVTVRMGKKGPEFKVRDFGVGITADNQRMIFESNFTTRETMEYSSGKPFDFNAGGKGFDLLRMKIFSERYHFEIKMISKRCLFIPRDENICPGKIENCKHCKTVQDCLKSGGTAMTVRFFLYNSEAL